MNPKGTNKKIEWTLDMLSFLKDNYQGMSNAELAKALDLKLTTLRMKLYEMGLKRMELEYWTEEQTQFLVQNYETMGDLEISEIFNARFPKKKQWTVKHIAKKRGYLKLVRTLQQLKQIKVRNTKAGRFAMCSAKMWQKIGIPKPGTIRINKGNGYSYKVIKTDKGFVKLSRYVWEQQNGPIPAGFNVCHIDGNSLNSNIENLKLVNDADQAGLYIGQKAIANLSDGYIAGMLTHGKKNKEIRKFILNTPEGRELIEIKRQQLLLNRELNKNPQ